jgi:C-terminal processing protease CtpA/Prc
MGFKEWEGWGLKPKAPHINVRVVFLTDGRAISYAESLLGIVKHYKLATIVGHATAGTNGTHNSFTLPGDYNISFTGMKAIKLDGGQHHGIGVIPDICVEKTIKAVIEGRDEFLEKAIEILKGEK